MQQNFINWLEKNKPKSARHYTSGFNTINNILKENKINELNDWKSDNYNENYTKLLAIEKFQKLNSTGNNILTATLTNYKKFMEKEVYTIPPIKPFDNFKWRWAVTTPSEGINTPEIIIGVLKILNKHNGVKHATQEFQDELLLLQNSINTRIDLAKVDRGLHKNIIENSGQYWKALGLINNTTGGQIDVTDLGASLAKEEITIDEFIKNLYSNFKLPNINIENPSTIQEWTEHNIEVFPIKLIIDILFTLKNNIKSPSSWFLTPEELKIIIIPLSVYRDLHLNRYVDEIIGYRKHPEKYDSWPDCTPGDNDFRMVNEYLIFLNNFGFVDRIDLKNKSKRFYINSKTLEIFNSEKLEDEISLSLGEITQIPFNLTEFEKSCIESGLNYTSTLITRYITSLTTKPFVLLSGLSGSGKTKLAQAFAQWIAEEETQYCIVPVGADWTNREPLLGYVNALNDDEYILPENGALKLLIEANKEENINKPYFLILDEMNLSHVERYFADFLSVMESEDLFKLHSSDALDGGNGILVESQYNWPKNLFIVGTVNIDETTYMFSPKVLDRANVIEFRVSETEMSDYFTNSMPLDLKKLNDKDGIPLGAKYGEDFVKIAINKTSSSSQELIDTLNAFFASLQKVGAEFGYRTASEIQTLFGQIDAINPDYAKADMINEKIDFAIMQKLLPKLHGSRNKLVPVLSALAILCYDKKPKLEKQTHIFDKRGTFVEKVIYPISLEKIERMYDNVIANGFTSYAEA